MIRLLQLQTIPLTPHDQTPQSEPVLEPPIITSDDLHQLGYQFADDAIENKEMKLQIIGLEHLDDGSPAGISFCCPIVTTDEGFILPHPLSFYLEDIVLEDVA